MADKEQPQKSFVNKRGGINSVVWEQYGVEEAEVDQKHIRCKICLGLLCALWFPFVTTTLATVGNMLTVWCVTDNSMAVCSGFILQA